MQVSPIAKTGEYLLRERKPRRQLRPEPPRINTMLNDPSAPRFVIYA